MYNLPKGARKADSPVITPYLIVSHCIAFYFLKIYQTRAWITSMVICQLRPPLHTSANRKEHQNGG